MLRCSPSLVVLALAAGVAHAAAAAHASPTEEDPKHASALRSIRAVRRTGEIRVDGRPDEAAWRAAPVGEGFLQSDPDDGSPATVATRFRILWDDESLYVAIECDDPLPPTALGSPRDRDIDSDLVRVDFDTTLDHRTAYHFGVYAAGQQVDGMHFDDTDYTADWDAPWESAVARTERGWSVEMRIPLRVLRIPQGARAFGLNVARTLTRRHEESAWQYQPREFAGVVSGYGLLTGLEGIHPVTRLELKPYLSGRGTCATTTTPAACQRGIDLGLDARYALTSELAGVATLNPDFGQVEIDERVLNLSTFETYLTEKRPFFLEGLDLFNLPFSSAYQLFYSRRIGAGPAEPPLAAGDALLSLPGARTIGGAAKLSGNAGGYSVQALTAFEPRAYARVLSQDGRTADRLAAEAAQATAVRARTALGPGALAGFAATALDPFELGGRHSFAAAADAVAFDSSHDWNAAGQVAGSVLAGGAESVLLDGNVLGSGATGWAASARLARDGGAINGALSFDALSPRFWVNDLGFMDRGNLVRFRPSLTLRDLHPQGRWQKASIGLSGDEQRSFEGVILRRTVSLDSSVTLNSYWALSTSASLILGAFDDRELGDGTPLQQRRAMRLSITADTDSRRPLIASFSAAQQIGERFQERRTALGVELKYRPHPALDTGLSLSYENDGGAIRRIRGATAGDDPENELPPATATQSARVYLLAPQYAQSVSAVLRAAASLTSRLSLQAFAQLFTEGVAYGDPLRATVGPGRSPVLLAALSPAAASDSPPNLDFRQADLSLSLVLRWEWRVGSFFYLAYAHQTAGSATPDDHRLSLFGDAGSLGGPFATKSDSVLFKMDVLAAL